MRWDGSAHVGFDSYQLLLLSFPRSSFQNSEPSRQFIQPCGEDAVCRTQAAANPGLGLAMWHRPHKILSRHVTTREAWLRKLASQPHLTESQQGTKPACLLISILVSNSTPVT